MEKLQLERREKIAAGIVLAALGTGAALYARKGDRLGHARNYPAGSFIIDVLKGAKERSIRLSGEIFSLDPLRIEVDNVEHTEADLTEIEKVFEIDSGQQ